MADWEGLRHSLEGSVEAPPLAALRQKRQRRQQRRAIATAFAVVVVGVAGGVTALDRRDAAPSPVAKGGTVDQFALGDRVPPKGDYTTYVVTDVDFVSASTGWSIGLRCAGETCDVATWRTDDGGRSWGPETAVAKRVSRESFTAQDPSGGGARSLRMVNETEGFAFNPDLYVTHDGARTWTRVPQPTKVASLGVADDSVWLFERGCAAEDDCDAVLRTATLGASFAPVTATIPATRGAEAIVRRSDSRHGYLVTWAAPEAPVAMLYRTADGGTTWQPAAHPCPAADVVSMSAGGGRLLLVCTTANRRMAFDSSDGATTWNRLPDLPAAGTVTDVVSVSAQIAYLTTKQPARLFVTYDYGATWTPARGTAQKAYGYGNLDVADPDHVWAMGDAGVLWRTTDGVAWERLALPPNAPKSVGTPRALLPVDKGVTFTSVSFLDPVDGFALGRVCVAHRCHAVLRRTADGGHTWRPVPAPKVSWIDDAGPTDSLDQVRFFSDHIGWLVGRGQSQETRDGGLTWHAGAVGNGDLVIWGRSLWSLSYEGCAGNPCGLSVARYSVDGDGGDTGAPSFGHASFEAPDGVHAYLLDDGLVAGHDNEGRLAATGDGGGTWTTYAAPCPTAASRTLSAWSVDHLWAGCVGADGRVAFAQSEDGGAHWHAVIASLSGDAVGTLVATSPTDAWLAANDGPLRVTRDGGATWSVVPLGSPGVEDLTFLSSPTQGWMLGTDGVLYATPDGETWERLGRP